MNFDAVINTFGLEIPSCNADEQRILEIIAQKINEWIHTDPAKLLQILYRLDIHEEKLKLQLSSQKENAAVMIAKFIMERERQKAESRKIFRNFPDVPDTEKW